MNKIDYQALREAAEKAKRMTGADWLAAIEMYKPTVRIVEVNVPRAAGIRIKGE